MMMNWSVSWSSLCVPMLAVSILSCSTLGSVTVGPSLQKRSLAIAKQLEESGALVDDPVLTAYVTRIGERLVAQADSRPVADFYFAILDQPMPNAFSIPSGHVYVSRGLLILLRSEDELAGVIGHEIGHVLEHHSLERVTGSLAIAPIRLVTRIAGGLVGLVLPRVGRVVKASVDLPAALTGASYGRSQENEADEVGQGLAAAAGWDPDALSRVMDVFARQQEISGQDPTKVSWFATHPTSPSRAMRIRGRAGELKVGPSQVIATTPAEFVSKLTDLVVGSSAANGVFDGSEFFHPGLGFAVRFPQGEEWAPVNTDRAAAVVREEPPALVILEMVAKGEDALLVAREFKPKQGRLDSPPVAEVVNDLPTARATGRVEGGRGDASVRASARWIAHDGFVYRILSESTDHGYALSAYDFDTAERSFRVLTSADRERIFEDRLFLVVAKAGETLAELLNRVGSGWDLEQAALANGVESEKAFREGDLVKATRRERYEPDR